MFIFYGCYGNCINMFAYGAGAWDEINPVMREGLILQALDE